MGHLKAIAKFAPDRRWGRRRRRYEPHSSSQVRVAHAVHRVEGLGTARAFLHARATAAKANSYGHGLAVINDVPFVARK